MCVSYFTDFSKVSFQNSFCPSGWLIPLNMRTCLRLLYQHDLFLFQIDSRILSNQKMYFQIYWLLTLEVLLSFYFLLSAWYFFLVCFVQMFVEVESSRFQVVFLHHIFIEVALPQSDLRFLFFLHFLFLSVLFALNKGVN